MAVATTQTIKGYELLEPIGEGSFGVVYHARQPLVDRDVAIKIIRCFSQQPNHLVSDRPAGNDEPSSEEDDGSLRQWVSAVCCPGTTPPSA